MRPIHNGLRVSIGSVLFVAIASLMMAADPVYWPTQCWRESTPEQQGLDSKKLAEVFHHVKRAEKGSNFALCHRRVHPAPK
jgi:hypothetical protein